MADTNTFITYDESIVSDRNALNHVKGSALQRLRHKSLED